ncbi:hypothetical protein QBC46DRAFT_8373 [Diplogelasinospora grovesii]|uniref:Uncharacterized protein n=1 Tax=Diplogelasinospora grovesii TaxID=303347 RepID=A0AAN6S8Q3_9PEZI|nr:hypothetical protein QBC46DRAFT_8373 [Diplogelasinospora grovesii]
MQGYTPGPCETLVSSVHGNGGFSDAENPINISHHSRGAVLTPASTKEAEDGDVVEGKVHYVLPTLRAPEEETTRGQLKGIAIVSNALEICVEPYFCDRDGKAPLPLHGRSKITQVELFAGRDLLGCWGADQAGGDEQQPLPADRDFRIHIGSDIHGHGDTSMFNENPKGLGVTLTVEFCDGNKGNGLMVCSVALVQSVGGRGYDMSQG